MNANAMIIAAGDAEHGCKDIADLRERCLAGFRAVRNHWMVTDENVQFQAGVIGIIAATTDANEKVRLNHSFRALAALHTGDFVGMERLAESEIEPVPLSSLWHESGEEGGK